MSALCVLGLLGGCGKKNPTTFISEPAEGGRDGATEVGGGRSGATEGRGGRSGATEVGGARSGADGGSGGRALDASGGREDAGALDSGGASYEPSGGADGVYSGEFETNDVFVIDSLKVAYIPVIAPVTNPNRYTYGLERFGNPADTYVAKFLGRSLIYDLGPGTKLRTFVPDLVGSPDPAKFKFPKLTEGTDPVIVTEPCLDGPELFLTGTGGQLIYQCVKRGPWYASGVQVYGGDAKLYALGANLLVFADISASTTPQFAVINLKDGAVYPTPEFEKPYLKSIRSSGSGFKVLDTATGGPLLFEVDATGQATQLGQYVDPVEFYYNSAALSADDVLYMQGIFHNATVYARDTLDGHSEIFYTPSSASYLSLASVGGLHTGP